MLATRSRELVLGRQPIGDRDHAAAAGIGEQAAQAFMGLEVADDKAAAMEIDERRQRLGRRIDRRVAAVGQGSGGSGQFAVADAADRHVLGISHFREFPQCLPTLDRADLPDFRPSGRNQKIEESLRVRIEWHQSYSMGLAICSDRAQARLYLSPPGRGRSSPKARIG